MTFGIPGGRSFIGATLWALPVAIALAVATVAHYGFNANGVCWALAQVLLVALAACDLATRRIPNVITVPAALLAVGLRAVFERPVLVEVLVAGGACLLAFGVFAFAARGGFGMGDVKLAGLLGFLLGSAVVPALVIGTLAGAVAALALVVGSRASVHTPIAYGPYLALGGAVAILGFHPPPLV